MKAYFGTIESMNPQPNIEPSATTHPPGVVELVCGCMFSGKTTALIKALREASANNVLILKHNKDDRYSQSQITTHDGDGFDAIPVASSRDILDRVRHETEVVIIDEGHFYDDGLPEVCQTLADQGKRVMVAALDLDMWGLQFEVIERIRELAGVVRVQRSICAACGKPATHTHRKTPIVNNQIVGGSEDFEPRCRECWSPPREAHINSNEMR